MNVEPTVPTATLGVLVTAKFAFGETPSISLTVQTPPVQEVDGLVLVTPAGGVIETVLVTLVCANAGAIVKIQTKQSARANESQRTTTPASAIRPLNA